VLTFDNPSSVINISIGMASSFPKLVPVKADGSILVKSPSLQQPGEKHCATCHAQDEPNKPLRACGQCRGALYCSEDCAQQLADRHRKLCFKYKVAQHPEGGNAARAVLFPGNRPKPEIVFVDSNRWAANAEDIVLTGLQPDDAALVTLTMLYNPISGRRPPYDMKIVFQKRHMPLTTSLLYCYNDNWQQPVPRFPWAGNIVVLRLRASTPTLRKILP
jgi:hypothetical protein